MENEISDPVEQMIYFQCFQETVSKCIIKINVQTNFRPKSRNVFLSGYV